MLGIDSLTALGIVLGFVVPGFIIGAVRALFLTGRRAAKPEAQLFEALALSTVNLAVCFPLLAVLAIHPDVSAWLISLSWLAVLVLIPIISGTLLGIAARKGWSQALLHKFGMAPVHAVPTAWDWKFGLCEECWVYVTLTDGTIFAGYCGANSFMSSDQMERDIYIETVFELDEADCWHQKESGVYIAPGRISTIEFWPVNRRKNNNAHSQIQPPVGPLETSGQGLPAASASDPTTPA